MNSFKTNGSALSRTIKKQTTSYTVINMEGTLERRKNTKSQLTLTVGGVVERARSVFDKTSKRKSLKCTHKGSCG